MSFPGGRPIAGRLEGELLIVLAHSPYGTSRCISTEVCVAFVALSAKSLGHEPYAILGASGTWSKLVEDAAIARMLQAGVTPITWVVSGPNFWSLGRLPPVKHMGS